MLAELVTPLFLGLIGLVFLVVFGTYMFVFEPWR